MRVLAIDAGNTRIKWGVWDGGNWTASGALPTAEAPRLERELGTVEVDRVVFSNVAGDDVAQAVHAATAAIGVPYTVRGEAEQCGVRSSYANPAQLGPDRWAALIGARQRVSGACVVVNAGTTMTVDALSAESIFLGGFIVPGFDLMRRALAGNTARLPLQEGRFSYFADNTADAITSGALNALAGAVDRMCRYVTETADDEPSVIVSGGNAALLVTHLSNKVQVVDNLVLEGLAHIGKSIV